MIDHATLPNLPANTSLSVGQQFSVSGEGFDYWPSEIVLGFAEANVEELPVTHQNLMRLVSKTDTELVFEVTTAFTFSTPHIWGVFGSPFDTPRTILAYD